MTISRNRTQAPLDREPVQQREQWRVPRCASPSAANALTGEETHPGRITRAPSSLASRRALSRVPEAISTTHVWRRMPHSPANSRVRARPPNAGCLRLNLRS